MVCRFFLYFLVLSLSSCHLSQNKNSENEISHEKGAFEPNREILEETLQWLLANPPHANNREERRNKMKVIQEACDKISNEDFIAYTRSWDDYDVANAFEEEHPALYYLREANAKALDDIRNTKVEQGVAIWQMYNMGYVFKTAESCFGIDIKMRHSGQLADVLDFLLITHEHQDHYSAEIIDAMIAARKPVITRWREGTTIINKPGEFNFGDVRVKIDIGDHHYSKPDGQDNMLMFQLDLGESANGYNIYHSGDGSNYLKMTPDRKIDLFIVHVNVGMSVEDAIAHLKPRMTFVSHVLELSHNTNPPEAWRWSFDYAFDRIMNIPKNEATVLTWGERWLAPQTILQKRSDK